MRIFLYVIQIILRINQIVFYSLNFFRKFLEMSKMMTWEANLGPKGGRGEKTDWKSEKFTVFLFWQIWWHKELIKFMLGTK